MLYLTVSLPLEGRPHVLVFAQGSVNYVVGPVLSLRERKERNLDRSSLDSGRGECVVIPHVHFYYWLGMCREDETGKKAECYSFIHFLSLFQR